MHQSEFSVLRRRTSSPRCWGFHAGFRCQVDKQRGLGLEAEEDEEDEDGQAGAEEGDDEGDDEVAATDEEEDALI